MSVSGRDLIARIANQVCVDHHDAFLVQIFGPNVANLGQKRIDDLLDSGVLGAEDLDRLLVPGAGCDYIEFVYHVNDHIRKHQTDLKKIEEMREWGIDIWTEIVAERVNELKAEPPTTNYVAGVVEIELPVNVPKPDMPVSVANNINPDIPQGLKPFEVYGYQQAIKYAGEYARGLGQQMGYDLEQTVREEWNEETILQEVDPELRAQKIELIREETAKEFLEFKDARALARRLADKTGEYVRDWERIARTELQAVYNDARVISGVEDFGSEAQIARIHEAGACDDCIRLCGDSQNPEVFTVQQLYDNGTNVGKRRRDWKATIFPIHPNCRCDTVVVPPGFTIKDGTMMRKET